MVAIEEYRMVLMAIYRVHNLVHVELWAELRQHAAPGWVVRLE